MKLLYITYSCKFYKDRTGNYAKPAYGDKYWKKYTKEFEEITILGEPANSKNGMVKICDSLKLEIIPPNSRPIDILKYDRVVKKALDYYISHAEAILIQPTSRKGMIAIKIANKYNKPFAIEITGDICLNLLTGESLIKKIYSPILYMQIRKSIRKCGFGLYVTKFYLQNRYPISGIECGCTDSIVERVDSTVLDKRIELIRHRDYDDIIRIGLIGSYSNNRKGIDVAIDALAILKTNNIELRVLGSGNYKDRERWLLYAHKKGIGNRLYFDEPVCDVELVFEWIDNIDILLLPSRSEGFPRCLVEACSRACPCIVSNVAGNGEIISSEWLHNDEDYNALATLIERMITNKDLMIQASCENFEISKKFLVSEQDKIRHIFFEQYKKIVGDCV